MSLQISLPQKIVVAVDGSDPSFKALNYASRLAGLSKSKVVALNVISLPPGTTPKTVEALKKELSAKAAEILLKANSISKSNGLDLETKTVETSQSIVMSIVEFASQEKADLIVMGTRGTSGYGRLMLGSVAAGVVSFANCPVLAVR
ncbi:MAG TPA: universal stress protein [Candidatus Angelobacter sp.]|nr:universal stress protein [Candidatus Angelobacter sp.]